MKSLIAPVIFRGNSRFLLRVLAFRLLLVLFRPFLFFSASIPFFFLELSLFPSSLLLIAVVTSPVERPGGTGKKTDDAGVLA